MSEVKVKQGYSIRLYGPEGNLIWERQLSGSSFDDNESLFYLGEEIIEQLPGGAFEDYKDEEDDKS
jgi:hypothetical protein